MVADVAILWDFESFWAQDLEWRPSVDITHAGLRARLLRAALARQHHGRLRPSGSGPLGLSPGHPPAQYLLSAPDAENLTRFVERGGTLLVSFFSGIVDENDAVHPGGFGAPLQDALGVRVEEFLPLREGSTCIVELSGDAPTHLTADAWQEDLTVEGAQVIGTYADGPGAGMPAITRHRHGDGVGWYISTRLSPESLGTLIADVYADAGIQASALPEGFEVVTRRGADADYVVAVNHRDDAVELPVTGVELHRRPRRRGFARGRRQ